MSGYFSRLMAGNNPKASARTLKPVVRSQSPIAEYDQRIGLEGFESAQFENTMTNTDSGVSEQYPDTSLSSPRRGTTIQHKPIAAPTNQSSSNTYSKEVRPVKSFTAFHDHQDTRRARRDPSSLSDTRVSGTTGIENNIPLDPTTVSKTSPSEQASNEIRSKTKPVTETSSGKKTTIKVSETKVETSMPDSSAAGSTLQVENPKIFPQHLSSATREGTETLLPSEKNNVKLAQNRYFQGPKTKPQNISQQRVIIDQLNVEVVQPQPVQPEKSIANKQPQSAATASVIGPLSKNVNTSLRLSLRHR